MSKKMKRDEGCFDPVDSYTTDPGYWVSHWQSNTDDYDEVCKNCIYHVEARRYPYPINSKKPPEIRHYCSKRSTFSDPFEVALTGFCRYYKPSNSPKDDKLEIVYHGHTVVLSNTADGVRVEIKEPKNGYIKTTINSMDFRGRKIKFNAPIEVPADRMRKAATAAKDIELPQEVIDFFGDVIEALNDKIKEKKDES